MTMFEGFWDLAESKLFRKNAFRVLVELKKGPKRYTDLYRVFGSPVTLSLRLGELEKLELIDTKLIKEEGTNKNKNGVYYVLTKRGKEITDIFRDFQLKVDEKIKEWENIERAHA